jgi:sodium transport system permease protein
MRGVWLIFKKEMLEFTKDRKTMLFTLALPIVLYPALFGIIGRMGSREERQALSSQTRVALVDDSKALEPLLLERPDEFRLVAAPEGDARKAIRDDELEMLVTLAPSAARDLEEHRTVPVEVLYNKVEKTGRVAMQRLEKVLEGLDRATVQRRLEALGASRQLADPTEIRASQAGGEELMLAKMLGTMLPYILMLMLFAGSMQLGVYVTAGERERGTLITLLATGLPRHEIIWGKMLYVFAMGIAVSVINIASMSVSMGGLFGSRMTERPAAAAAGGGTDARAADFAAGAAAGAAQVSDAVAAAGADRAAAGADRAEAEAEAIADADVQTRGLAAVVTPMAVLLILLLMVPMGLMFSTLIIMLGIQAKNSQEAGTSMMPIMLVVIFLSVFSMSPGIEKMGALPYIPIVNVSLVIRKLFAQQASALEYAVAFLMTMGLAALLTYLSTKFLNRESAIFKST